MAVVGESWMEWLVQTNDVGQLWAAQPTYLISQAVYIFAGLTTLAHAISKGGRWPYLWLAIVLHGIYADNFWHFVLPEYDNFWHSQTPIMLLGRRLPLHIILVYPAFVYHAAHAISKLRLPSYAEPFAVALVTVLIDLPYDIVAVKFVHWTWHDTDPNVFDRHYWVPWNSYYFHATFTASFIYFFHASRRWFAPKEQQWQAAGALSEWKSLLVAVLLGMPGGVLLFVPIYHPLHDMLAIHSEVTFFLLLAVFGGIVLIGLLSERVPEKSGPSKMDYLLLFQLAVHFATYLLLLLFFRPEDEVSVGLHEPVGPCNEKASLVTPFGQTLYKRKFFCPTDYDEGYFDFHCVNNQLPANGKTWYTICGTPLPNKAEYLTVVSSILVLAAAVFYGLYFKTYKILAGEMSSKTSKKMKTK